MWVENTLNFLRIGMEDDIYDILREKWNVQPFSNSFGKFVGMVHSRTEPYIEEVVDDVKERLHCDISDLPMPIAVVSG